jgi:hypothetical protein
MMNLDASELEPGLLPITQAWADIRKRDRREVPSTIFVKPRRQPRAFRTSLAWWLKPA